MNNELIQKAAEALDIALGRTGVFNPPELDFMCAAYDGLVAALQPSPPQDVEEWIERNELVVAAGSEVNSVIKTSALRAFLAGKVLVPVEPTKEMVVAGHHAAWRRIPSIFDFDDAENVYKAMLTASKGE